MAGEPGAGLSSPPTPTKAAAWARSSASCSVRSDTITKSPTLKKSDQKTPWLMVSRPSRPRNAVGRRMPNPSGPSARKDTEHALLTERGDDQGVEPHEETGRDAREGAPAVAKPPVEAEKDGGTALGHRDERQQPHPDQQQLAVLHPRLEKPQAHDREHGQARVEGGEPVDG